MLGIKNNVTEMQNAIGGLLSRLDTAEERIRDLEHRSMEISQTEMQREIRMKTNVNIQALWDSFKRYSLCVI